MYVAIVTLVQPTPDVQFESTAKFSVLHSTFRGCVPGSSAATRGRNSDCNWSAQSEVGNFSQMYCTQNAKSSRIATAIELLQGSVVDCKIEHRLYVINHRHQELGPVP